MTLNNKDLDIEKPGTTTISEKIKLRTEIARVSIAERMEDFWRDYEVGQNPGVICASDYTTRRFY